MDINPLHNLEHDLIKNDRIVTKCKTSEVYSQNLYSALCNNRFFYGTSEWTCSWRMSGGIVADLRDKGETYLDFYCSGIASDHITGYVPEGVVTEEIREDLLKLGWTVEPYEREISPGIYTNSWSW